MAVNLIGCLITGAGILPAKGRFLVSHTVRTAILSDYLADYDILILRFADLYAAARWGI